MRKGVSAKTLWRIAIGLAALALIAAAVSWSYRERPVPVQTAILRVGEFEKVVSEEARTRVRRDYVITTPATGQLPQLEWQVGDPVKKGQVLFTYIYDFNMPVRAPADGVILEVLYRDRQAMARGVPVLRIGDPADLEVIAEVLTEEAVGIAPGQDVRLRGWGEDRVLAGRVRQVEPSAREKISPLGVAEQRVNVIIDFTGDRRHWQGLSIGYKVRADIITAREKNALLLPLGALMQTTEGFRVFRVEGDIARERGVILNAQGLNEASVQSGVQAGDRVILFPGPDVQDGRKVSAP